MSRIVKKIEIEGREALAIFDTGAMHSYVVRHLLKDVPVRPVLDPYKVAIGRRVIEVKEYCSINGRIEGLGFHTGGIPIDELGRINGQTIDALIGALTMEEWEIIPNPRDGTLDLSGLKRREFTEV